VHDDLTIPPELAALATAHPQYEFSRRWTAPGVVKYTAQGDLTTHPYAVVTSDLGELMAVLCAGSTR